VALRLLLEHPPARWETRTVTAEVAGKSTSANILHLRGLDGIQQAQGLPDAARDFLIMHVKTLPAGSSDTYVVNLDLANEWAKTHPRIPSAEPTAPKSDGTAGCDKWTWHCAGEAGQHAIDQASQQADELREQAEKDWDTATSDAIKVWNEGPACFEPRTLSAAGDTGPLQADPSVGYTLTESGKTSGNGITASGTATGKVNLALPLGATFKATASVSFIPCLPFAILPTSIGGSGDMTIGNKLTASLNASGKFDYDLKVPNPESAVAPKIPLEVIPIVIFGIPICEMDVSLYVEGDLDVSATGSLSANFELDYPHEVTFDFLCSTPSSCSGDIAAKNLPITTTENVTLKGQIAVTPDVYVALQLDFDIDGITVRSGPEPKLYGFLNGCYMGSAAQTVGGPSSSTEQHLLTGDLDWRLQMRSDFFLLGIPIDNPWMFPKIGVPQTHLWYEDLLGPGGSNGLDPIIAAPTTAVTSGNPATFTISMPKCDPYADAVTYKVAWTGNAKMAEAGTTKDCLIGEGGAICTEVPTKPFDLDFTWPSAGSDSITVTPVTDAHGRKYAIPPTQLNVDVQGPAISAPADTSIKQ
jgi:hypothetical protein